MCDTSYVIFLRLTL